MRAQPDRRIRKAWVTTTIAIVAAVALIDSRASAPPSRPSDSTPQVRVGGAYGNLPLSFEEDRGRPIRE